MGSECAANFIKMSSISWRAAPCRRVSRGEEIVITRHDQPVARIVPEGRPRLDEVQSAVKELRLLRQKIGSRKGFKPLSNKEIREAINKGRR